MWLATSLTVTKPKLETESHADKQTFRITKDSVFTIYDHKLKPRMRGIVWWFFHVSNFVFQHLKSEVNPVSTPRDLIWDGVVRKRDSLDHIHPKPANLGEQFSISGSKDLLTAANRLLDPAEELWSFLLLLQWQFLQSSRQCSLENTFQNTLVMITWKVSIRCHSSFAIYSEVNNKKQHIWTKERSWSKFQHIHVSLSMSSVIESNHLIFT